MGCIHLQISARVEAGVRATVRPRLLRFSLVFIWIGLVSVPAIASPSESETVEDVSQLSLADLANVEVTSVSKAPQTIRRAAASIYVISHDDIARSGAVNIPEVLRLAPNLLVTQLTSNDYVIAARGLGGNPKDQNFANKMLILVDGRSVYNPLFSGIYTDSFDVLLEDIERIEVISGPGATLWGANAMNGVINIITRKSYVTTGSFVSVGAGNQDQTMSARYGGKAGDDATFRVYGLGFHTGAMELEDGSTAHDGWSKGQGGFRLDWSSDRDTVTVQGDLYRGLENQLGSGDLLISGGNVVSRYQHHGERSDLQIQAYLDQTEREGPIGDGGFVLHTYDVELQQTIDVAAAHHVIWGAGERLNSYDIANTTTLLFIPPHRALTLGDAFLQDTISLGASLDLIAGIKLEDDPFSGWTPLPDLRASWEINLKIDIWAAASRAIRSPTPFDHDVVEKIGPTVFLTGNPEFRPERVDTYETGMRLDPVPTVSISAAVFYNVYDDLRTIDPGSNTAFLPLQWRNSMQGDTDGLEAWADWQVTPWWRLSPGVTWLHERLEIKPGASGLLGVTQAADDPSSHATLKSSMNWGRQVSFDASLRYVGALPSPGLPTPGLSAYCEMDARLGWRATNALDVSVSGQNLLHARLNEFAVPYGEYITRSVMAEARWKF
jgi:iron complex outermembrane receptor protein